MTAGAAAAAVAAAALAQASIHETTAGDNPAALMHQSPIAELLGAFTSGTLQSEVAVVVCGPQRVRTLFGSAGLPGLLPLLLARCTEVQLDASSPSSSSTSGLFGLSAFYALPEDQGGLLPALDALCGRFEQHDAWETCEVETFTDLHKVFATVVRVLASLGRAGVSSNVRCLGRVPLIFRVCFFSQADGHSGDGTGVACSSLFFVEAPPATAGGPLPAAYRKTSARFGSGNCCVLHAAVGSAPDDVSHIRSSLGPLQALFDHQHADQRFGARTSVFARSRWQRCAGKCRSHCSVRTDCSASSAVPVPSAGRTSRLLHSWPNIVRKTLQCQRCRLWGQMLSWRHWRGSGSGRRRN
mmetsp:Transcript_58455/g.189352  ORF Transcript_58455/g.189352 Transcript_58455/m.189352 type:complete len:355 (-) Transcript_58455:848-1912(-)